jgi:hypothetical protein
MGGRPLQSLPGASLWAIRASLAEKLCGIAWHRAINLARGPLARA